MKKVAKKAKMFRRRKLLKCEMGAHSRPQTRLKLTIIFALRRCRRDFRLFANEESK